MNSKEHKKTKTVDIQISTLTWNLELMTKPKAFLVLKNKCYNTLNF